MAKKIAKDEIVTFKVDGSLLDAMKGVPNRSQFIRHAILVALNSVCPVCKGTGCLTPNQREHWEAFSTDHALEECRECHEVRLVCRRRRGGRRPAGSSPHARRR